MYLQGHKPTLVMGHKNVVQRTRRQVYYIDGGWGEICTYIYEQITLLT